jgi:hypothetical protein
MGICLVNIPRHTKKPLMMANVSHCGIKCLIRLDGTFGRMKNFNILIIQINIFYQGLACSMQLHFKVCEPTFERIIIL